MRLNLAFTPCPNDTFMFHAIASGRLSLPGTTMDVHLHDIETLNEGALAARYDITKVSFAAWLKVREKYNLLPVGAALGFGCGPLVIAKPAFALADMPHCRVALPGELTTAHLLFRLWAPQVKNKIFVPYQEIFNAVSSGQADCGVIIHESRFTYEAMGFKCLGDLGEWWERTTELPMPLGCIIAKKELPESLAHDFTALLRSSILDARTNPDGLMEYMKKHAQEMDEAVLMKHVATYVNEYSLDLKAAGRKAVAKLETLAGAMT